jgi:hypothetical protein
MRSISQQQQGRGELALLPLRLSRDSIDDSLPSLRQQLRKLRPTGFGAPQPLVASVEKVGDTLLLAEWGQMYHKGTYTLSRQVINIYARSHRSKQSRREC